MNLPEYQNENLKHFLISEESNAEYYWRIINNLDKTELDNIFSIPNITNTQVLFTNDNFEEIKFIPKKAADTVLDYYGKLFLGIICGYFPLNLDNDLTQKMIRFLELKPIREYYKSKFKYFLPQAIVGYCFANEYGDISMPVSYSERARGIFIDFIIMQREYSANQNIQQFIRIIDDFDNFEIEKHKLIDKFKSTASIQLEEMYDEENAAFIGAVQLLDYLNELLQLIEKSAEFKLIQSTIWHFYGYLLETRRDAIISFYTQMLGEYRNSISKYDFQNLEDMSQENIHEMRKIFSDFIKDSLMNLHFLLDEKNYSLQLREMVKHHLSKFGEMVPA